MDLPISHPIQPARTETPSHSSARTHRTYVVRGQRISAHEEGSPRRKVALLIHGWSSSWFALSPLMTMLSERYHCVAIDLPGYGDSPRPTERISIPWYANLLADLIRQEWPGQQVVLVGHSMGGMISLTMAMRHPELIERMVLIGPTISGQLSMFIKMFIAPITFLERWSLASKLNSALEPHALNLVDRLMRPASFAERTGITPQEYTRLRADARRPGQNRVRAECYTAMQRSDLRNRLGGLSIPALVIWGLEDNTVPLRDASVVADEWPEADLRFVPKAGHWPQFEAPDITQRYVRSFLSTPVKLLKVQF